MKIVSAAEMREIDRVTTERFGVPSLTLMEKAGEAVTEFALDAYPSAKTFGVICGKGNNGGDGFVVARLLHERGKEVRLLVLADPSELRGDAAANFKKLPSRSQTGARFSIFHGLDAPGAEEVFDCPILIDAILGTGFRPPVSGEYAKAIAKINATPAKVIAVDIPSGADADVMGGQTGAIARADAIVTFTAPKPAHVWGNLTSGPTVIVPIGSPDEAVQSSFNLNLVTAKDIAQLFAPRPRDSNKGMYGHVLVIGGSFGKAGAAAMAGFSALRAGAGLVTVATAKSALATVAGFHPELMTEPLAETDEGTIALGAQVPIEKLAEKKTVLAIGPGMSRNAETAEMVRGTVLGAEAAIVLDADGLNAFEGKSEALVRKGHETGGDRGDEGNRSRRTLVLTPHPGEMSRLTGMSMAEIQRDRVHIAREFAVKHGLILVLKGDRTIVAGPDGEAWVNPTGNPGMATGGTGDILTGIVAGLVAQFPKRAFDAVLAAVYLHGLAGDVACESTGEQALVATDLIKALPEAIKRVRKEAAAEWAKI